LGEVEETYTKAKRRKLGRNVYHNIKNFLKKLGGKIRTGFIWLRTGTNGGML